MDARRHKTYPLQEFEALAAVEPLGPSRSTAPPPWMDDLDPPGALSESSFIEQAAYVYHPTLDKIDAWLPFGDLPGVAPGVRVVEYAPDAVVTPPEPPPGIYYVVEGRFKLVAERGGVRRVFSQCRPGQILGLPRLLRVYYARRRIQASWPVETRVEAVHVGRSQPHLRFIPMADALRLMDERPDFRRFVENNVVVRYVRRRKLLERASEGYGLFPLKPADMEYLLQLGRLLRFDPPEEARSVVYLPEGKPSNRAAFLISGEATLSLPPGRYLGKVSAGHTIGDEGFVLPPGAPICEPARPTEIRLSAGSQILEFYWYALRSVMAEHPWVWRRLTAVFQGEASTSSTPQGMLVAFQAARPGLDVDRLAYGTAAALGRDCGALVCVVDLQGQARWSRQGPRQGPAGYESLRGARAVEGRLRDLRDTTDAIIEHGGLCDALPVPFDQRVGTVPELRVLWPLRCGEANRIDAGKVEALVESLRKEGARWIVICDDGSDAGVSTDVAEHLNVQSAMVFYVADDADAEYGPCDEEPNEITWVYRMNRGYLERERQRVRGLADTDLGPQRPLRRIVRVPDVMDDPAKEPGFVLARAFEPEVMKRLPEARAYQRLARAAEGRLVGLALSGGGAWGFAHIPFIQALEAAGVPVDYVTGTSFGSIVGALYAAGGSVGLAEFVADNCCKPGAWSALGLGGAAMAVLDSELTCVTLFYTPLSSMAMQRFVNRLCRRHGRGEPLLTTTEVPFYPVGTDLDTQTELFNVQKSLGWGARMSGAMPPLFANVPIEVTGGGGDPVRDDDGPGYSTFRVTTPHAREVHHIVDGAFIANVPSRAARQVGAGFVIASNVIPPTRTEQDSAHSLPGAMSRLLPSALMDRANDLNRGTYLQTWKGGDDQGQLHADFRVSLQPEGFEFYELWRGADICEQVGDQIAARGLTALLARWDDHHPARRAARRS